MKTFHDIAELEQVIGHHLGVSDWHTVTQDQIDTFAAATGDHQWIHVDTEAAARGPFGGTIAHGYLTLSLVPHLLWQIYRMDGVKMTVNYGANKLRFPAPVPVGSRIRASAELLSVTPGSAGHHVITRVTLEREGGDKPVCVVDTVTLLIAP